MTDERAIFPVSHRRGYAKYSNLVSVAGKYKTISHFQLFYKHEGGPDDGRELSLYRPVTTFGLDERPCLVACWPHWSPKLVLYHN